MPEGQEFRGQDQEFDRFAQEPEEELLEETGPKKKEVAENAHLDKLRHAYSQLPEHISGSQLGTDINKVIKNITVGYTNNGPLPELDELSVRLQEEVIDILNEDEEDSEQFARKSLKPIGEEVQEIIA
jgi:hypothetical protein